MKVWSKMSRSNCKQISLEKENVIRIVIDVICAFLILFFMALLYLISFSLIPFLILLVFLLIFLFAAFSEIYECIFYDEKHFEVRSIGSKQNVKYCDIEKIKRETVRAKTVRGGCYWRYIVSVKTSEGNKKLIVPFPQNLLNENLQDLFTQIKNANSNVVWSLPENFYEIVK